MTISSEKSKVTIVNYAWIPSVVHFKVIIQTYNGTICDLDVNYNVYFRLSKSRYLPLIAFAHCTVFLDKFCQTNQGILSKLSLELDFAEIGSVLIGVLDRK